MVRESIVKKIESEGTSPALANAYGRPRVPAPTTVLTKVTIERIGPVPWGFFLGRTAILSSSCRR